MNREVHVRFWEGLMVEFPWPTQLYNGVDIGRFQLDDFDKIAYRKGLRFECNDFLVGMFANFTEQKNHRNLIEAIDTMTDKKNKKNCVVLCGDGTTFEMVRKLS